MVELVVMRTKGVIFLIWLASMIYAQADDHVTELWRTNFGDYDGMRYHLNDAVLDANDNMVIAADETQGFVNPHGYLCKFSSTGEKLWEYSGQSEQLTGIACVKVDDGGNVYFTGLTNYAGEFLTFGKLSAQGTLLWRKEVNSTLNNGLSHALHVQPDGTSYILSWLVLGNEEEDFETTMSVSKYSSGGDVLWTAELPGRHLASGPTDMKKLMHVDASGNVLVTAASLDEGGSSVFVLKLDSAGNLLWRTTFPAISVTSVLPGPQGICVGLYEGFALLGPDGTLLKKSLAHYGVLQVRDALDNGQFLLESLFIKQYVLLNPDGTLGWTADTQAWQLANPLKDGNNGWLTTAYINHNGAPSEYSLIALRLDGNQRWRQPVMRFYQQNYQAYSSDFKSGDRLFRASDGTLRLVCRQVYSLSPREAEAYGIGLVAYRLEESDVGPQIVSTPPSVVDWNGSEDLNLAYTVTGDGALSYGTGFSIPQSQSTITISQAQYPEARGLYRWDVTDANGRRAATRNVQVRINQVRLYPDLAGQKLNVLSDYFTRVRVEYSTNLVDWLPWHRQPEGIGGSQIDVPIGSSTNYFYRALKIE